MAAQRRFDSIFLNPNEKGEYEGSIGGKAMVITQLPDESIGVSLDGQVVGTFNKQSNDYGEFYVVKVGDDAYATVFGSSKKDNRPYCRLRKMAPKQDDGGSGSRPSSYGKRKTAKHARVRKSAAKTKRKAS